MQHKPEAPIGVALAQKKITWPLERILFAMGGTVTLVSALLIALVSPWFLLLTAFAGVNQWLFVTARACPASMVLKRLGVEPQCRW
jgi:Zn-dependent protease